MSIYTVNLIIIACEHSLRSIELDHQHTFLAHQQKYIVLKNQGCTYYQLISQRECGEAIRMWYLNGTSQVVIQANHLTQDNTAVVFRLMIVEIEGISESCRMLQQYYFQLDPNGKTINVVLSSLPN